MSKRAHAWQINIKVGDRGIERVIRLMAPERSFTGILLRLREHLNTKPGLRWRTKRFIHRRVCTCLSEELRLCALIWNDLGKYPGRPRTKRVRASRDFEEASEEAPLDRRPRLDPERKRSMLAAQFDDD